MDSALTLIDLDTFARFVGGTLRMQYAKLTHVLWRATIISITCDNGIIVIGYGDGEIWKPESNVWNPAHSPCGEILIPLANIAHVKYLAGNHLNLTSQDGMIWELFLPNKYDPDKDLH